MGTPLGRPARIPSLLWIAIRQPLSLLALGTDVEQVRRNKGTPSHTDLTGTQYPQHTRGTQSLASKHLFNVRTQR